MSKHKVRRIFSRFKMANGFGMIARIRFAFGHISIFHPMNCDCMECE